MRANCGFCLALVLVGCQPSAPTDTVESLTVDAARLKEVQQQCKQDRAKLGDAVCKAASEAYRRRFMGEVKAKDRLKQ